MNAAAVDVVIRRATAADSHAIAPLVSGLGYRTTAEQMRKRLESILGDKDYDTLIACDGERVIGFIGVRVGPLYEDDHPYGQIMALAVTVDSQRRAVGTRLLEAAESALISRGASVSVVASGSQRVDAHAFYAKNGYAWTGRRYRKALL